MGDSYKEGQRNRKKIRIKLSKSVNKPLARLLANVIKQFSSSKYVLKPHQEQGVKWLLEKELLGDKLGGILSDDPGLGKTIEMAALIAANSPASNQDTTLIIVPTSVVGQWTDVMAYVVGKDKVYVHTGTNRAKTGGELCERCLNSKVCITTYGIIARSLFSTESGMEHAGPFLGYPWFRVVLDEGHIIRNPSSKINRACMTMNATHRWILSGTPIQNSEKDFKSIMRFIRAPETDVKDFAGNYVLRRTKEILYERNILHRFTIINHSCEFMSKYEQFLYKTILTQTIDEYNSSITKGPSFTSNQMSLLELLIRLRQATIHPNMVLKAIHKKYPECNFDKLCMDYIPTKISYIVDELKKTTGMTLVFTHFNYEQQYLKKCLETHKIYSEIYNGGLSIAQRSAILSKFKSSNQLSLKINGRKVQIKPSPIRPTVLIIQIKAGGVGLNLQQFNNVFIVSPDWNPANEIQAIARAHRIGQTKRVNVHKFTLISNQKFSEELHKEYEGDSSSDDGYKSCLDFTTIDERILQTQLDKRLIMTDILTDDTLRFNEAFVSYTGKFTDFKDTVY
jgi:SNF2 family DNA or RNA helicase